MTKRAHDMPFGATLADDGVRFALWAPSARDVELVIGERTLPMPVDDGGWRRLHVPGATAGTLYRYRVDGELLVPDPASRFQPQDVAGPSEVIDGTAYAWSDAAWSGRPWADAVIVELHVGTATPEGTYAALAERLEHYAGLGVTAIELMPLADAPGRRGWGYDGVLLFAPNGAYGRPNDLQRLIDRAHALGLMMLLDVVYNHFGPSGNYLNAYARDVFTERHHTPWGAAINFDGAGAAPVRDFFVHNALYWLEEFHFDGLRLDAVHAIADDSERHILAELAERVRAALPDRQIHLVLENDANEARWLKRDGEGKPRLYSAQWNDDIHHAFHVALTGERHGYYEDYPEPVRQLERCLAEGFAYQGEVSPHRGGKARGEPSHALPPDAFVAFLQNHDQIGNRAFGERLTVLAAPERLALARATLLLSPQVPLLFMGEEWAAETTFRYFVDFAGDPALSAAVRDGRRREFASFPQFADPAAAKLIPDPTEAATFLASRLDWEERQRGQHAEALAATRALLKLRHEVVVPLLKSGFDGADRRGSGDAIDVTWRFAAGVLRLQANLSDAALPIEPPADAQLVWRGPGAFDRGPSLPAWSAIFTLASGGHGDA